MKNLENAHVIEGFNKNTSYDVTFDVYNTLKPSKIEETVSSIGNKLSKIYCITCSPFEIEEWKSNPEIYDILKRYQHTAEGRQLEILIGKYNTDTMKEMVNKVEELKQQYEGLGIQINPPKQYVYMIGYYGGTSGRTIQAVITSFKKIFPNKITILN